MVSPTTSKLVALSRLAAAVIGLVLSAAAGWICTQNLGRFAWDGWVFWLPVTLALAVSAGLCWWFALRGDRTRSRDAIGMTWAAGLLVGSVGFVLGFVGPLVVTPSSNLGPLLGILITGPLGFVAGALGGFAWSARRSL